MKQHRKGRQKVNGLSNAQVLASRNRYGSNVFTPVAKEPWWKKFLEKFRDPLIVILLIAGMLSIGIALYEYFTPGGEAANLFEPVGIFIAIGLATGLSFFFEQRAEKEFSVLNQVKDDELVQVIRDSKVRSIPKRDVVVGDVVLFQTGDEIPADGTLIKAVNLRVDESTLTGEPETVKTVQPQDHPSGEETFPANMVYRGTTVMEGHGAMVVSAVGDATENGKVHREAQIDNYVRTPLNEQLDRLSRWITNWSYSIAGLIIVVGTFVHFEWDWQCLPIAAIVGIFFYLVMFKFKNYSRVKSIALIIVFFLLFIVVVAGLSESVSPNIDLPEHLTAVMKIIMVAVTLIVVAVPEGLPMAVALSLAYNMRRMLKNNNLVRRMHACETMGAVTVICTDKTGTLTQNRMQVAESRYFGEWSEEDGDHRQVLAESIAVNATAQLEYPAEGGSPVVLGNPTEGAMLLWLEGKGYDYLSMRNDAEVLYEIPFTTERKFMATEVVSGVDSKRRLYVKGAPGIVRAMCDSGIAGGVSTDEVKDIIEGYQSQAMRTLALAVADLEGDDEGIVNCQIATSQLQLVGVVAISDPVRREVPAAIQQCRNAGIEVKIVTGDSQNTAREIAREIGIWTDDTDEKCLITGFDFEALSDEDLRERVKTLKVIARARPMDKKRLVEALQANGEVVAVTGDGTNDAPALHTAHVGLSMGSGTAVAKEASDITIIDNSFAGIGSAVMWGRSLYRNIQRFLMFQLTVNIIACLVVLVGSFMNIDPPLTVTQMLWINLIMDTFAAMALASLPPDEQVMNDPPRNRKDFILPNKYINRTIMSGVAGFVVMFVMLLMLLYNEVTRFSDLILRFPEMINAIVQTTPHELTRYEETLFFTTFVMMQFWNIFNARAFLTDKSALHLKHCRGFLIIVGVILVGQLLMVEIDGFNDIFRAEPLPVEDWAWIIGLSSFVLWLGELYRILFGKKRKTTDNTNHTIDSHNERDPQNSAFQRHHSDVQRLEGDSSDAKLPAAANHI